MSQPKVRSALIANQHPRVRRGLRLVLEALSYESITEASDGGDALSVALSIRPDVAVIDVSLWGLSGLELLDALKSELPRTNVVIYTLHQREDWRRLAMAAGADAYILMDEPPTRLIAALEAIHPH